MTPVYTGSRFQRVRLLRAPAYNEQIPFVLKSLTAMLKSSGTTSTLLKLSFLCIYLLVLNGTQCNNPLNRNDFARLPTSIENPALFLMRSAGNSTVVPPSGIVFIRV